MLLPCHSHISRMAPRSAAPHYLQSTHVSSDQKMESQKVTGTPIVRPGDLWEQFPHGPGPRSHSPESNRTLSRPYPLGPFPPAAWQLFNPELHAPLPESDPELLHQQQQQQQYLFSTAYNLPRCEPGPEPLREFSPPLRPTAPKQAYALRPPPGPSLGPVQVPALQQAHREVFMSSPPVTPGSVSSLSSGSCHPAGTPHQGVAHPPLVSQPEVLPLPLGTLYNPPLLPLLPVQPFPARPPPLWAAPLARFNDIRHGHGHLHGLTSQNPRYLSRISAEQPMHHAGFVSDKRTPLRRPSGSRPAHVRLPSLSEVLSHGCDEHVVGEGLVRLPPIARTPTDEAFGQDGYNFGWPSPVSSQPTYCEVSASVEAVATPSQGMLTPITTERTQLSETPTGSRLDTSALSSPSIHWRYTEDTSAMEDLSTAGQTAARTSVKPTLDPLAWEILYSVQAEEPPACPRDSPSLPSGELPKPEADMNAVPIGDTPPFLEGTPSPYVAPNSLSADNTPPQSSMSLRPHCYAYLGIVRHLTALGSRKRHSTPAGPEPQTKRRFVTGKDMPSSLPTSRPYDATVKTLLTRLRTCSLGFKPSHLSEVSLLATAFGAEGRHLVDSLITSYRTFWTLTSQPTSLNPWHITSDVCPEPLLAEHPSLQALATAWCAVAKLEGVMHAGLGRLGELFIMKMRWEVALLWKTIKKMRGEECERVECIMEELTGFCLRGRSHQPPIGRTLTHVGWYLSGLVGEEKGYAAGKLVAWTNLGRVVRVLGLGVLAILPKTDWMTPYPALSRDGYLSSERLKEALKVLQEEEPSLRRICDACHERVMTPILEGKPPAILPASMAPAGCSLEELWLGVLVRNGSGTKTSPIVIAEDEIDDGLRSDGSAIPPSSGVEVQHDKQGEPGSVQETSRAPPDGERRGSSTLRWATITTPTDYPTVYMPPAEGKPWL